MCRLKICDFLPFSRPGSFLRVLPLSLLPVGLLLPHPCIPPSPDAKHRAESELGPQTRPRSNTLPKSFGSTLDQGAPDAAGDAKGPGPTREETLELIQHRVKGKRQEDGWPDDIKVKVLCSNDQWT